MVTVCVLLQSAGEKATNSKVSHLVKLSSTGSCLPRISSGLYVKCARGLTHCQTDNSLVSLWKHDGSKSDLASVYSVSRCRVCARHVQ